MLRAESVLLEECGVPVRGGEGGFDICAIAVIGDWGDDGECYHWFCCC